MYPSLKDLYKLYKRISLDQTVKLVDIMPEQCLSKWYRIVDNYLELNGKYLRLYKAVPNLCCAGFIFSYKNVEYFRIYVSDDMNTKFAVYTITIDELEKR